MNTPSQPRAAAFTLIELLVVIAIIAVLMGLLFPAVGIVKEQARKAQAKNDVMNIVAAVKQYYTEYGKYPQVETTITDATKDATIGDPASNSTVTHNSDLFNTLRAINAGINVSNIYNPRAIVFFDGKRVSDATSPRGGFVDGVDDPATAGSFYDPWGKQYNIIIDQNYNNLLEIDTQYTDFAGPTKNPRGGVGAYSLGKDNLLGNKGDMTYKNATNTSDDVISWQ